MVTVNGLAVPAAQIVYSDLDIPPQKIKKNLCSTFSTPASDNATSLVAHCVIYIVIVLCLCCDCAVTVTVL